MILQKTIKEHNPNWIMEYSNDMDVIYKNI